MTSEKETAFGSRDVRKVAQERGGWLRKFRPAEGLCCWFSSCFRSKNEKSKARTNIYKKTYKAPADRAGTAAEEEEDAFQSIGRRRMTSLLLRVPSPSAFTRASLNGRSRPTMRATAIRREWLWTACWVSASRFWRSLRDASGSEFSVVWSLLTS